MPVEKKMKGEFLITMKILTSEYILADFFMKGENFTAPASHIMPSQVHGKNIIVINDDNISDFVLPKRPEADGILLLTSRAGASLRFADCAPVMIWAEKWVMILHSGYKGTVLNISREGLEIVSNIFGRKAAINSNAWIGPCIGREYFRKSDDEWTVKGINAFHRENYDVKDGHVYFDLSGEIKSQLIDCGLTGKNIKLSGIDTLHDDRCCSYRRGDIHERMTLFVKLIQ